MNSIEKDQLKEQIEKEFSYYKTWLNNFAYAYIRNTAEKIIVPKIKGKKVLEMGCSTLIMSQLLLEASYSLEIVEGSSSFVDLAINTFKGRCVVHHSLFEDFTPPAHKYEAVVLANTLHHISDPANLLMRVREWIDESGSLHVVVPNSYSLHRRLGVKMGILSDVFDMTDCNKLFKQYGQYTHETLIELFESSGYIVKEIHGVFLKPFSDEQMDMISLSQKAIDALFEIGKEFPELASFIYIEVKPK